MSWIMKPGEPLPRYVPTVIFACPVCYSDLDDEAFSYWCRPCGRSWSFTEVIAMEGDRIDD